MVFATNIYWAVNATQTIIRTIDNGSVPLLRLSLTSEPTLP
jgi:hypothetical protein